MNVPMTLFTHSGTDDHVEPLSGYTIQFHDDGENPCTIKTQSGEPVSCKNKRFTLGVTYSIQHIMLASAFPDIPPLETVDHINGDPSNDHVNNLRWMTRSQNSADSWKGRRGIHTSVRQAVDCLAAVPNGVTPDVVVWRCSSYGEAAKVILPTVSKQTPTPKDLETAANRISEASRGVRASAYGWCWRQVPAEAVAEDEEWRPFTSGDVTVQVSNYGYVDNIHGVTIGNKTRGMSSRKFSIKGNNVYVHRAVYEAFIRKLDPKEQVVHVHGTPKDTDGCYLNELRYLDVANNIKRVVRSSGIPDPAESSELVLTDQEDMVADPYCENDETIVPASFAEALKLYTPPVRRREFNGASFMTYGSLSAMYKNGHIAIFDERFEDQVKKLTWCFDSSKSGDSNKTSKGPWYTTIRTAASPQGSPPVVDNFERLLVVTENGKDSDQKVRLHKFIYFLNNPQVTKEDFKIYVTPINCYTWDCRVENIGLTTTCCLKPPPPVELSEEVQAKMGMKFLPKDFFLQAGGSTLATTDVNGRKLKKVCRGTDDMVDKLKGLITEVGEGFRKVDPQYDTKNATYLALAESALAAKGQFVAMFLD
jgi:hypothetical protein